MAEITIEYAAEPDALPVGSVVRNESRGPCWTRFGVSSREA